MPLATSAPDLTDPIDTPPPTGWGSDAGLWPAFLDRRESDGSDSDLESNSLLTACGGARVWGKWARGPGGSLDERRNIAAGTHDCFCFVAVVEVNCAFNCVSSVCIVPVNPDSHTRTHDLEILVFSAHSTVHIGQIGVIYRSIVDESRLEGVIDSKYAHDVSDLVCIFGKLILSTYNPRGERMEHLKTKNDAGYCAKRREDTTDTKELNLN